ncbi:MAG: hypothetical protein NUW21_11570, partial [Elusimicrobia bacterium]|nr:hypothetical protein [Elusimicrobiota bacterium]
MRNALIRLAPCAVFLSVLASGQAVVEKPVTPGTNTGSMGAVPGIGGNAPSSNLGGATSTGLGLQPGLGGVGLTPSPVAGAVNPAAVNPAAVTPASVSPVTGAALPI